MSIRGHSPAPSQRGRRDRLETASTLGVALTLGAVLAWLILSQPGLVSGDSYFHARAAQQLAEHGVQRTFPQAAFSTFATSYSDKDFLFHLLLAALNGEPGQLVSGAKGLTIALGCGFFMAIAGAMLQLGSRGGALWLVLMAASEAWLWLHLAQARPHLLGMLLVVAEVALILRGRNWTLLAVAALHVWSHTSFVVVPALAAARIAAGLASRRGGGWRQFGAVCLGLLVASLLHPYFPNNLSLLYDQVFEVARSVWLERIDVPSDLFGPELLPMAPRLVASTALLWAPTLLVAIAQLSRPHTRPSVDALALYIMAALLFAGAVLSTRLLAFFLPVCAIAGARGTAEFAAVLDWPAARWRQVVAAATAVAALLVAVPLRGHVARTIARIETSRGVEDTAGAVAFIDAAAAPHEIIFHPFWAPFASLYYHRPDGRYIVALDPIFLYRFDAALFAKMLSIYRGTADDPVSIIRDDFRARFVFIPRDRKYQAMLKRLAREPALERVYDDGHAIVLRVRSS